LTGFVTAVETARTVWSAFSAASTAESVIFPTFTSSPFT
jgi:hypothetical protein